MTALGRRGRRGARRRRPRPRADARPLPGRDGFVERDGGRIVYEVYGAGEPPILLVPPWQIVHSRLWKRRSPTSPAPPGGHVGQPRQRPLGPADRPDGPRDARARRELARGDGRDRRRSARSWSGCRRRRGRSLLLAAEHPERVAGARRSSARRRRSATPGRAGRPRRSRSALRRRRGLGQGQHPLLASRLRGLPRVLLRRGLHRAALDEAASRTPSAGGSTRTSRRSPPRSRTPRTLDDGRRSRRCCRRDPLPDARHPRHRRADPHVTPGRSACATAIPARGSSCIDGGGPPPPCPRPGQGQPAAPRLHRVAGRATR